ncbi:response regulator receiver protein [Solidesulfovibrio fructosivorans JJ]]|uniref:Response regulator receiver protein n=1 Tax=Solidesulfovibrio fructosivorans JJ] TaxID=596151 RepID=E1JUF7_SOLFR|nr:response regulator [Solidesulfovibrio fructosivorans]EFL52087.1 response regulator receiver protein [Solidesulfovibrio fructosivorans JJ]]
MKRCQASLVIAERNANIRELLRREFGREGYAVTTAGSGAEVLARLREPERADLLVLDAEIGDTDGESLVPRLTRLFPKLPVVLHVFAGQEGDEDGVVRVRKEGDFERLKHAVREVLATRAGSDDPGKAG